MNKTAVELLRTNASYIDALKEAIDRWEKSNDTEEKRDLLAPLVRSALTYITVTGSLASCRRKHR